MLPGYTHVFTQCRHSHTCLHSPQRTKTLACMLGTKTKYFGSMQIRNEPSDPFPCSLSPDLKSDDRREEYFISDTHTHDGIQFNHNRRHTHQVVALQFQVVPERDAKSKNQTHKHNISIVFALAQDGVVSRQVIFPNCTVINIIAMKPNSHFCDDCLGGTNICFTSKCICARGIN